MNDPLYIFSTFFDKSNPPQYQVFSPYRISPIGAHSDHQNGSVTGFTINKGLKFYVSPTNNATVQLISLDFDGVTCLNLHDAVVEKQGNWGDYIRGAVKYLKKDLKFDRGLKGVVKGEIPVGGISSSAALLCGFIAIISQLNELNLSDFQIINYASRAEREYVGLRNGILDQGCVVLSQPQKLLNLNTKTNKYELLPFGDGNTHLPFQIGVFYSGQSRSLMNQNSFNLRVDECKAAAWMLEGYENSKVRQFADTHLGDISEEVYEKHKDKIPESFRKRATHFFTEENRLVKSLEYWRNGDIKGYGKLMFEACESLIENYECGSPELITLYNILKQTEGVFGGRFSGAGMKGHCIALIDTTLKQKVRQQVRNKYFEKYPKHKDQFDVFFCQTSGGIDFRKEIQSKINQA